MAILQSEETLPVPAPHLHVGLVADAGKEEQGQSKLLVHASNSLKLATWGASQANTVSAFLTSVVITCRL